MDILKKLQDAAVVPVVVLDRAEDAVPTAKAMLAGGIGVMEITFRTAAAADSIQAVAENCPDMLVGAGTVFGQAVMPAGYEPMTFVLTPAGGFVVLGLCLAAVCTAYTAGLNQPATTVVAQKRELPVYSVERDDKVVSISFDASWGADKTIPILDILDQYGVKTTFFLVGGWVDKYPDMVKEIFARGHEIGNHSNTHPQMSKLGEEGIRDELRMMSDKVEKLTGVRPTLFRPPYGDYNNRVVQVSRAEGYEAVQWSIDSLDWKDRGTQDIINR